VAEVTAKNQNQAYTKELTFALEIAKRAGEVAMRHYEAGIKAEMKSDNTPVTAADKECERLIRQALESEFPGDQLLGEEEGESSSASHSTRKWIIDPIDGTYNYARQIPIWSTLLALEDKGEVILGVVHAPAMGETLWAERGGGAWRNGERLHVSAIDQVSQAMFVWGAPNRIFDQGMWDGFKRTVEASYRQRGYGDYLNFSMVFQGKAEAVLEVGVKAWDLAPMKILAEESGGRYYDLEGGDSIYTGSCLITNGLLHDKFVELLDV
jgi:histidinol-phosphatase